MQKIKRKVVACQTWMRDQLGICFPPSDMHDSGVRKKGFKTFYYFLHTIRTLPRQTASSSDRQWRKWRRRRRRRSLEPTWPPLWVPLSWITSPPLSHRYQQADVNDREHVPQSVIDGNPIRRLISEKTDKVSETPYFNCWQSISTGVLGSVESL